MAAFVAKIISKKILGERLENQFGTEDPYFEYVPATRLNGKPSKKLKKRKKALPPGITEKDGKVLTKVKRRAYRLDMSLFSFMGIRFGWGSVIGLIPGFGDVLDMFMAMMVMKTCSQIEGGLPSGLRAKMMYNIVIDFFIGLVPFIGDIADAAFRCNSRNALLLEQHLREIGQENLRRNGLPIPDVDPSSPEEFDRSQRDGHETGTAHRQPSKRTRPPQEPVAPEPAQVRKDSRWFGRSKARPQDVETGTRSERVRQDSRRESRR